MDKTKLNYIVDILLTISFIAVFVTGIVKFPGLLGALGINRGNIPWSPISRLHDWSGLIMGILVFAHLALNWNFMVAMTKKYFGRKK